MAIEYLNNKEFEQSINNFQKSKKMKARCELVLEDIESRIARTTKKKKELKREQEELLKEAKASHLDATINYEKEQAELAFKFLTLSEHLAQYFHFNLIEPEDAIQEGVVVCFDKVDRFNVKRGKAFNYFTTVCANHYRQLHRTSKNYHELKKRYFNYQHEKTSKTIVKNGKEMIIYK
jgi:DNA-directed RNA polymerase specialized sigma subunit